MKIGQTPELPVSGTPATPKKVAQEQQTAPANSPYIDTGESNDSKVTEKETATEGDCTAYDKLMNDYAKFGYEKICQDCFDHDHWRFECPTSQASGSVTEDL